MASENPRPGQPDRFDRYGYEKMDYDRLMRESWYLKDSAEYAMSLGRKDPDLRQKIIALQKEFARRGFTAAATVLNAFLRKSFSRPGAKDMMASHKESFQKEYILWALPKGETDRLHERPIAEGITTPQQMDDAKRKAASQGWHGFRVQILDMNKPFRWMSRPGEKDTMAVEDRFYFGKERFAENNDGWALQSVNVPDWGTHHFPSEAAARKYAVEKGYNYEMRLLYNGKTVAIKRWDNTWSNR